MATYVVLASFTDQGITNVKDSPDRLGAFKAAAKKVGVTVKNVYYTMGSFDVVVIAEGSEEAVTLSLVKLGSLGNIRTQTMRAFNPEEMKAIITKMS